MQVLQQNPCTAHNTRTGTPVGPTHVVIGNTIIDLDEEESKRKRVKGRNQDYLDHLITATFENTGFNWDLKSVRLTDMKAQLSKRFYERIDDCSAQRWYALTTDYRKGMIAELSQELMLVLTRLADQAYQALRLKNPRLPRDLLSKGFFRNDQHVITSETIRSKYDGRLIIAPWVKKVTDVPCPFMVAVEDEYDKMDMGIELYATPVWHKKPDHLALETEDRLMAQDNHLLGIVRDLWDDGLTADAFRLGQEMRKRKRVQYDIDELERKRVNANMRILQIRRRLEAACLESRVQAVHNARQHLANHVTPLLHHWSSRIWADEETLLARCTARQGPAERHEGMSDHGVDFGTQNED